MGTAALPLGCILYAKTYTKRGEIVHLFPSCNTFMLSIFPVCLDPVLSWSCEVTWRSMSLPQSLCRTVFPHGLPVYPTDGGSRFLWNTGTSLSYCMLFCAPQTVVFILVHHDSSVLMTSLNSEPWPFCVYIIVIW
jgi:hypothetical protein